MKTILQDTIAHHAALVASEQSVENMSVESHDTDVLIQEKMVNLEQSIKVLLEHTADDENCKLIAQQVQTDWAALKASMSAGEEVSLESFVGNLFGRLMRKIKPVRGKDPVVVERRAKDDEAFQSITGQLASRVRFHADTAHFESTNDYSVNIEADNGMRIEMFSLAEAVSSVQGKVLNVNRPWIADGIFVYEDAEFPPKNADDGEYIFKLPRGIRILESVDEPTIAVVIASPALHEDEHLNDGHLCSMAVVLVDHTDVSSVKTLLEAIEQDMMAKAVKDVKHRAVLTF